MQSELRHIDPQSGKVLESVEMPAGVFVSGLESDGKDRFYCGGGKSGKVRAVKRPKARVMIVPRVGISAPLVVRHTPSTTASYSRADSVQAFAREASGDVSLRNAGAARRTSRCYRSAPWLTASYTLPDFQRKSRLQMPRNARIALPEIQLDVLPASVSSERFSASAAHMASRVVRDSVLA